MKIKHFIAVLLWLLVAIGCRNDDWVNSHQGHIRVFANLPALSRVNFSQNDSVTYADWEEGDKIYLYSKKQGRLSYEYSAIKMKVGLLNLNPWVIILKPKKVIRYMHVFLVTTYREVI